MNISFQRIISSLILTLGMILFLFIIIAKEFMFAIIVASFTMISWILYQVLINKKINYKLIGNVIFISGLIIGVSVFFVFGVEQVAYPAGSIKFKASGIAKSLGVILFSMVPALMFYIVEDTLPKLSISRKEALKDTSANDFSLPTSSKETQINDTVYDEDEWEEVSEEDLENEEYEPSSS
tara:strand:+ start:1046 stop:1588 length:543 start_codon:yes stop_codon:yes gene_type:complete